MQITNNNKKDSLISIGIIFISTGILLLIGAVGFILGRGPAPQNKTLSVEDTIIRKSDLIEMANRIERLQSALADCERQNEQSSGSTVDDPPSDKKASATSRTSNGVRPTDARRGINHKSPVGAETASATSETSNGGRPTTHHH